MPLVTIASAMSLISFSLTLQANLFQLFQPIGGVLARPLSCALALDQQQAKTKTTAISVFIVVLCERDVSHKGTKEDTKAQRKNGLFVPLCLPLCLCVKYSSLYSDRLSYPCIG